MILLDAADRPRGMTPQFGQLAPASGIEPERAGIFREPEPGPSVGDVFGAAFGLENDVVNAIDAIRRPTFKPDPDPDAWLEEEDFYRGSKYEQFYQDSFVGVRSRAEAQSVMSRIDREEEQRATLARGGFLGTVASVAAGVLSPTSLIPVGGWIATAGRGARALRGAAAGAAGGAAGAAIQEGVLQSTQETRTAAQSVFNVMGATILSGVLGGAISGLTGRETGRLVESLESIPATRAEEADLFQRAVGATSVGAAAAEDARGSGELKGALGAEQVFRFQDPMIRLQSSPFTAARNTVRDLAETPLTLAENAEGIATSIGGAVETRIRMAEAPLAEALRGLDRDFSDYFFGSQRRLAPLRATVASAAGRGGGRLTYGQFKEAVFDAMLSGDVHPIPEVQAAARRLRERVYNPLRDEAMEFIPGFRAAVEEMADDAGYINRVYNTEAIRANRSGFVNILTSAFTARQRELARTLDELEARGEKVDPGARQQAELSEAEVRSIAEEVTDTILGTSPARMILPGDLVAGPRGALKERTLRIPTRLIRDFLERDPEVLARIYTRTMATDTNLVRRFGSTDLAEQLRKVNDEAAAMIRDAPERSAEIEKAKSAALRDLSAIRDRLRGTYALPDNPDGLIHRASRVVRNLNYLRLLGGMTLSAIPDIARTVMVHGLTRSLRTAFVPLVHGLRTLKPAAEEVKLAGTALDMVLDSRAMALADIMDDYGRGSRFERALETGTRRFGIVSLMAPWNAFWKQFAGIISQTRMLEAIERVEAGSASTKEVEYLAAGGIDAPTAGRIAEQFKAHGVKDGAVWWANTSEWTDRQAIEAFRAHLSRDVNRIIVSPGQDKPLWMSTPLGKIIGQFRSFNISSAQRVLLSGLQQRDMATLNGAIMMLGLGALTYYVKQTAAGLPVSSDPRKWAVEAADRSGLFGWIMDVNNSAEKLTRGRIGLSAITGEFASRYASRNIAGAFLGPTFDLGLDLSQAVGAVSSGEWKATDTHVVRKLLPLQNLIGLRTLFDAAERGTDRVLGIPETAH